MAKVNRYSIWMADIEDISQAEGITWPFANVSMAWIRQLYSSGMSPRDAWEEIKAQGLYENPSRTSNPGRPPKKWMRRCVAGASRSAADPGAVCGSLWHHKMSPAKKRAALAKERRGNPCCGEGYQPGFFSNPNRGY